MRGHYFYCLCVVCLALPGATESSFKSVRHSVILSPPAETTEDVLEGLARIATPESLPSSVGEPQMEYAVARQRMLDAEKVAIKRIVREVIASANRAGAN